MYLLVMSGQNWEETPSTSRKKYKTRLYLEHLQSIPLEFDTNNASQ